MRKQIATAMTIIAGLLILALVFTEWIAPSRSGGDLPDWVEIQDGPVAHSAYQDYFYRSVIFKGNAKIQGDLTVNGATALGTDLELTGPVTLTNHLTVGDEVTDYLRLRGGLRTWQSGSDYWPDISDVSALDRATGAHLAWNITGWGTASSFQALFANAQVTSTALTTPTIYGGELKATYSGVRGTTATGIGAMGKVIAKSNASIPTAYGLYSRLETNGAGNYIYNGSNFYADLDNTGSITTSTILGAAADTWTYGIDLDAATISGVDIRLSNGETISNTGDGIIALGGNLLVTGTTDLDDTLVVDGRVTLYNDTWVGGGFEVGNDAEITGTLTLNDLEVTGTTILDSLDVDGLATAYTLTVETDLNADRDVTIAGDMVEFGSPTFWDDAAIGANLDVTGTTTLDDLDVGGDTTLLGITVSGASDFWDAVTIGNDLEVTGTTTLDDLDVGGDTTLLGITVSGASDFWDDAAIGANLDVTGTTTVDDLVVGGSLSIAGVPLITSEEIPVAYETVISRTTGATNGHIRLTSTAAITNATLADGSTAGEYLVLTGSNVSGDVVVLEGSNVWGGALTFTNSAGDGGTMVWDGTRWVLLSWHDN